ncbi:MAG TPA: DUF1178 family protein [Casimicrobiaceae bacterium]|nr:DUF1178 family protein [Casimicrobiaceae bacterium]
MIVYELACAHLHRFEGWFASAEDYERQRRSAMIRCPMCDDAAIERRPSANIQVGHAPAPAPAATPTPSTEPAETVAVSGEAELLKHLRKMVRSAADVGAAFPDEARKIHYEEVPKRAIRGQATSEEAEALREEGIDFLSLPAFLTRDLQ